MVYKYHTTTLLFDFGGFYMGCWGMGLTQSDEYCEIYEQFIEEYDEGKPVKDITKDILEEYLDEFDENDGIMHDVYFAIGKAEWMCGGISTEILAKITEIVQNDENIKFYRELGATEKNLKLRKKNLEKFLSGLLIPRDKIRKRRTPVENYTPKSNQSKPFPNAKVGDFFGYSYDNHYRVFALTEKTKLYDLPVMYCYVWRKKFDNLPTFEQLLKEDFLPIGYLTNEEFPTKEKLTYIGNYSIVEMLSLAIPYMINKQWKPATYAVAKEKHFTEDFPKELCTAFEEALEIVLSQTRIK